MTNDIRKECDHSKDICYLKDICVAYPHNRFDSSIPNDFTQEECIRTLMLITIMRLEKPIQEVIDKHVTTKKLIYLEKTIQEALKKHLISMERISKDLQ